MTKGTAYTRSAYFTEAFLNVVLFARPGKLKNLSKLGKVSTASEALNVGKAASGISKVEDIANYSNKVDDILLREGIIRKSNKVSKGAESIKAPFEIPVGGVAGDDMGAMLKGAGKPNSKEVFLDAASSHDSARKNINRRT